MTNNLGFPHLPGDVVLNMPEDKLQALATEFASRLYREVSAFAAPHRFEGPLTTAKEMLGAQILNLALNKFYDHLA